MAIKRHDKSIYLPNENEKSVIGKGHLTNNKYQMRQRQFETEAKKG